MDPFTIATGVAGILSLGIQITQITNEYIKSVKSAPKEVQDLAIQTNALIDVLKKLEEFLRSGSAEHITFQPDSGLQLVLNNCQTKLECLFKKLKRRHPSDKRKLSAALDRLTWPLEKQECVETLRRLYEYTQTFHFCLTITNWYVHVDL